MRFFCPKCWIDLGEDVTRCPHCGLDIAEFWGKKDYVEKLIFALDHPEPETPIRAAYILGTLRDNRAVGPLINLVNRTPDVYIAAEAVKALAQFAIPLVHQFLRRVASNYPAAIVRYLAAEAVSGSSGRSVEDGMKPGAVDLEMQGGVIRTFTDLALDFTGTLSLDGVLLPGVAERLAGIAASLRITILTADTFGTAAEQLKDLPVEVRVIRSGNDKAEAVRRMGGANVIAIGNGRNDVPMLSVAGLRIAVIGPEGASTELLQVADVVVRDIWQALELVTYPLRLKATLRD